MPDDFSELTPSTGSGRDPLAPLDLGGVVALPRDYLSNHPLRKRDPKESLMSALVDLYLLANTIDRTICIRGQDIPIRRGQLAWSIQGLCKRWRWSDEFTSKFLKALEKRGDIAMERSHRQSIITLNHYPPLATALATEWETVLDTDLETDQAGEVASELARKGREGKEGNRREGRTSAGEAVYDTDGNCPNEEEIEAFGAKYSGSPAKGVPGPMPQIWVLDWMTKAMSRRCFPARWRVVMQRQFERDWLMGLPMAKPGGTGSFTAEARAAQVEGTTAKRIRLEREITALMAQWEDHPCNPESTASCLPLSAQQEMEGREWGEKIAAKKRELAGVGE